MRIDAGAGQADLVVVSGLPNSCYEFEDYDMTRDGDTIKVDVTNLKPADATIACAEIYRTVETTISLGSDVEPCQVFNVDVNGMTETVQAIAPNVRCSSPVTGSDRDKVSVIAPIESVKINVAESFPLQYFLHVVSGLPNGCAEFEDYEVTRDGNDINVRVTNLEPAQDQPIACTLIYRMHESNIALGSDFEDGQKYTVHVNDVTETFVARGQGGGEPAPLLGREFRLEFGKSITIEPEDLQIKFVNVVEDSRCPVDALCVWAGRAIILIGVTSKGRGLGELELRLDPENQELVEGEIGDYLITISGLNPHPETEDPIEESDYIVSLIVTEAKGTVFEY